MHSKLLTSEMYQKFYCSQVELVTQVKSFNTIGKIKGTSWKCTSLVKKAQGNVFLASFKMKMDLGQCEVIALLPNIIRKMKNGTLP